MLDRIKRNIVNKAIEENLDGLVRFAFFRLKDRSMAEDTVHEAVVRLLDNSSSLLTPGSVKAYLYRIVYNLCQDTFRTSGRNLPLNSVEETAFEENERLDREEAKRINRLFDRLPQKESEVIRMNVIDELSFAEISRILSVPVSTIKSRYKSGMEKLRQSYSTNKMS